MVSRPRLYLVLHFAQTDFHVLEYSDIPDLIFLHVLIYIKIMFEMALF